MIKGFIFDLDGVLTDTAELHYRAWKRLADEELLPFTRADNERLRGVSRRESLNRLLKGRVIDDHTAQLWMDRKNGYYVDYLAAMTSNNLLPGVREFLLVARAAKIKIGVASSSWNARTVIDHLEIAPLLDALGDGPTVANSKPAPDLFLWVAGRLDLVTTECVVFEDASDGIDAARTAGMWSVGIGPASRVGKAHLVCNGLGELTIDAVLGLGTED
jgi:beta-phosphoglucomutase